MEPSAFKFVKKATKCAGHWLTIPSKKISPLNPYYF
jgi:hypothetical protein